MAIELWKGERLTEVEESLHNIIKWGGVPRYFECTGMVEIVPYTKETIKEYKRAVASIKKTITYLRMIELLEHRSINQEVFRDELKERRAVLRKDTSVCLSV